MCSCFLHSGRHGLLHPVGSTQPQSLSNAAAPASRLSLVTLVRRNRTTFEATSGGGPREIYQAIPTPTCAAGKARTKLPEFPLRTPKVCNILLQFTPPSQRISARPPPPLHHPCCLSTAVAPVAPPVTSLSSSAMPAAGCARPGNTSVWAAGGYSVALMSGAFVNPARAIYRNRQRLRHGH